MRVVTDGTDERTREVDGDAPIPGLKYGFERLAVRTTDLNSGET
jgi:hypothetical protein